MAFASPVLQRVPARLLSVCGYGMDLKRTVLVAPGGTYGVTREPTDAVGTFSLTLRNLVPGSAVQVQTAAGAPLYNATAAGTVLLVPLTAFAPGSALNDLQVKVRKGSAAPFYQPWSTQVQAEPGAASIFVSQTPDE